MISSDHQSPIASSDRAIGQASPSKLVRFTMIWSFRDRTVLSPFTRSCGCILKPDGLDGNYSFMMKPLEANVRLKNKTALITGGNSGIGLATAKLFVAEGAKVVITGRNKETLEAAAKELGPNGLALAADATDIAATEAAIKKGAETFGKFDIVFANAGIAGGKPLGSATLEVFEKVISTNLNGVFFNVQYALPYLNDNASIVLNVSVISVLGVHGYSAYRASKAGVREIPRIIVSELAPRCTGGIVDAD